MEDQIEESNIEENTEPIIVAEKLPEEPHNVIEEKYHQMIDDLEKELAPFKDIDPSEENERKYREVFYEVVQSHMGISIDTMKVSISEFIMKHAEELSMQFVNIAPFNDYDNILEDNDDIAAFLRKDGCKIEHWKFCAFEPSDISKDLMKFSFACTATDENDEFVGFVFVNSLGKIKHSFAQGGEG